MKLALEPASVLAPAKPAQPLESHAAAYNRWGAVGGSGVALPDLDRHAPSERDPRLYQSATLGSALVYGILWLDLEVRLVTAVAIIVTALLTQLACTRLTAAPAGFRHSRRVNSG